MLTRVMAGVWFLGSAGDAGVMCMSASSALRVHPWQSSHRGWTSCPASGFILTLATGRGKSQLLWSEARALLHYHLQTSQQLLPNPYPPGTEMPGQKTWGSKPRSPQWIKTQWQITTIWWRRINTFLNANVKRCGTFYKALKAAPASSLTPHTCPELWFLIPGTKNPIQVAVVTEITVHTPTTS